MTLNEKNTHSYSSTELKLINDILKLLERLKMATDEWQSSKSVSISLVYPIIFLIVKYLQSVDNLSVPGRKLCNSLIDNVIFRFSLEDEEFLKDLSVHIRASFLDPRFNHLEFLKNHLSEAVVGQISEQLKITTCEVQDINDEEPMKKSRLSLLLDSNKLVKIANENHDEIQQ